MVDNEDNLSFAGDVVVPVDLPCVVDGFVVISTGSDEFGVSNDILEDDCGVTDDFDGFDVVFCVNSVKFVDDDIGERLS
jgi:hypothetical protein